MRFYKITAILLSLFFITACTPEVKVEEPNKVYTQVGMWYLNKKLEVFTKGDVLSKGESVVATGTIPSVNYSRDVFIPVNSLVTIIKDNAKDKILFKYDKKIIVMINKEAYTGLSEDKLLTKMFSKIPVDLSTLTEHERNLVSKGEVELYMSKEALILSRGYPPIHQTPNLKDQIWRYWEARFDSRNYFFQDNKLIRLQD